MAYIYGYDAKEHSDELVTVSGEAIEIITSSMSPGAVLVNDFPFCE